MDQAVHRGRPVSIGSRVAAVLAAPLAPLVGLLVAYLLYHPPRPRRRSAPSARARLHAWRCPGDPQRVVVLGHGIGLDKSRSLAQARLLHRAGYTVVLFDFR